MLADHATGIAVLLAPMAVEDPQYILRRFETMLTQSEGSTGGDGIQGRILVVKFAWEHFLESPLVGWGPGFVYDNTAVFFPTKGGRDTHNSYVQILAEQGLVGAAAHVALFGAFARYAWLQYPKLGRRARSLVYFSSVGLLAYFAMMATLGKLMTGSMLFMVLGLLLAWLRAADEPEALPKWLRPEDADAVPSAGC